MACCVCDSEGDGYIITCRVCNKVFHPSCLASGRPSPVHGDIFFYLTCSECHSSGKDDLKRMKLPWLTVVHLALYNLQLLGGGKCGYFKWKDSIVAYIEKNWQVFFPGERKKTCWSGTVAGILSTWSPQFFSSGSSVIGEPGWWKLSVTNPPSLEQVLQSSKAVGKGKSSYKEPAVIIPGGNRSKRARVSSIQAAIELKARRDNTLEAKEIKRRITEKNRPSQQDTTKSSKNLVSILKINAKSMKGANVPSSSNIQQIQKSPLVKKESVSEEKMKELCIATGDSVAELLGVKDGDSDLEIDPCALSPSFHADLNGEEGAVHVKEEPQQWDEIMAPFCDMSENETSQSSFMSCISDARTSDETSSLNVKVKVEGHTSDNSVSQDASQTQSSYPDIGEQSRSSSALGLCERESSPAVDQLQQHKGLQDKEETSSESSSGPSRRKRKMKEEIKAPEGPPVQYAPISLYEEKQLLNKLKNVDCNDPKVRRFRRKLLLREVKREHGLPVFDVDGMMNRLVGQKNELYGVHFNNTTENSRATSSVQKDHLKSSDVRILDRFQTSHSIRRHASGASFLNKLVGTEDHQLQSIRSPYTARVLKPFIRRDYESRPKKMKLLMEIQGYPHRHDDSWRADDPPSIDYCYVQPQHIPSVNALSREFFWPGIDLSECLQYPDFSCVVLYRKFVIGFAFMVPDVKHNEAYISFIFTHPEWRGAGIATFMVYHLIQTCMGKDITLHVSANNPAMLLYQKFGFKQEEFILDFYDKYFPLESRDSRHAFFLRLRR